MLLKLQGEFLSIVVVVIFFIFFIGCLGLHSRHVPQIYHLVQTGDSPFNCSGGIWGPAFTFGGHLMTSFILSQSLDLW
jgi:hypothetical protein